MHVHRSYKQVGDKRYQSVFIRESFREHGKVKKRSLLNISNWPENKIAALDAVLKDEQLVKHDQIQVGSGKNFGALFAFLNLAKSFKLPEALGNSRFGQLALMMICLRPIKATSKVGTVLIAKNQAVKELLGIQGFDEDDLYGTLDWLHENQAKLEEELFKSRGGQNHTLFLYDVTSSYVEGHENELAKYGYNRDKKNGEKQIVIGLLKDEAGRFVSVQVYEGNTNDQKTVHDQIVKLKDRFKVKRICLVGDRGMLKSAQVDELSEHKWNYITAITKPQIQSLINAGVIQLDLFDENVCEVEHEGQRYILRRNKQRAEKVAATRKDKLEELDKLVAEANDKLLTSKRVNKEKTFQRLCAWVSSRCLDQFVTLSLNGKRIKALLDQEKVDAAGRLDGCYALITDLPKAEYDTEVIHDRYKDLGAVEEGFRMMKSSLDVRPMWHRRADRTRGHVFAVALSLMLLEEFQTRIEKLDIPTEVAIDALNNIQLTELQLGTESVPRLPKRLRPDQIQILNALNLKLPASVKPVA